MENQSKINERKEIEKNQRYNIPIKGEKLAIIKLVAGSIMFLTLVIYYTYESSPKSYPGIFHFISFELLGSFPKGKYDKSIQKDEVSG